MKFERFHMGIAKYELSLFNTTTPLDDHWKV